MLTHCATQQIETERLILRQFNLSDWKSMNKIWVSAPEVQHGYGEPTYVTEATKAVINYGFEKINFNKVQICHRANNYPSARVIQKIGFHKDGILREYFLYRR